MSNHIILASCSSRDVLTQTTRTERAFLARALQAVERASNSAQMHTKTILGCDPCLYLDLSIQHPESEAFAHIRATKRRGVRRVIALSQFHPAKTEWHGEFYRKEFRRMRSVTIEDIHRFIGPCMDNFLRLSTRGGGTQ